MKIFNHSPGLWSLASSQNALFAFLCSRLLILLILVVATQVKLEPIQGWEGTIFQPTLDLSLSSVRHSLALKLLGADASWYVGIAEGGYSRAPAEINQPQNWVFFPLLPLMLRGLTYLTGSYLISGVIISNLALLGALIVLEQLAPLLGFSSRSAKFAVWLVAFWPMSYFFSAPLTESSFLLLLELSYLALLRGKPITAGVFFGLLTACRPTGMLMLPGFALSVWRLKQTNSLRGLGALLLAPLGLVAFLLYLWSLTGNPLIFADNQQYWGRGSSLQQMVLAVVSEPQRLMVAWNFILLNSLAALLVLWASWKLIRLRLYDLAFLVALPIAIALSTGTVQSLTRFTMVMFPVFLIMAANIKTELGERIALGVSASLLAGMTVMYGLSLTAAMA